MKLNAFNLGMPNNWLPPKLLMIMRLIIVIMITFLLQVSAGTFAQKITLSEKNAALTDVFSQIKAQTGYDFLFNATTLKDAKPVTIHVKSQELTEVLKTIFTDQLLEYSIENGSVVVSRKKPSFLENIIARFQAIDVRGIVLDEKGLPLLGATVFVRGTGKKVMTNDKGEFYLQSVEEGTVLIIRFMGYEEREIKAAKEMGEIKLVLSTGMLDEVDVVSTGYQKISKERVTGSYFKLEEADLKRTVSTSVMGRLANVVPGLIFNKSSQSDAYQSNISIRGQSTLFSKPDPLIVIDNFPYEGDLNNINPEDVQNITVLRDAATASIWGAKAANGVIVITTKSGHYNNPMQVSFNTTMTIGDKPDLNYDPRMSVKDYIAIERRLFDEGFYTANESNLNKPVLSPVIESLYMQENGTISEQELNLRLKEFENIDLRNEKEKYLYQKSINQQYTVNLSGGAKNHSYYLSTGYDRNLENLIRNSYSRVTVKATNSLSMLNNKLQLSSDINYVSSIQAANNSSTLLNMTDTRELYPYAKLMDEGDRPAIVFKDYRHSYIMGLREHEPSLLDWTYRPLEEIELSNNRRYNRDYRLGINTKYHLIDGLNIQAIYQYGMNTINVEKENSVNSYFTRNEINRFTKVNEDGSVVRPIPLGGIMDQDNKRSESHKFRSQLNFNKAIYQDISLDAIAGIDISNYHTKGTTVRLFGHNPERAGISMVDYIGSYQSYINPANQGLKISFNDDVHDLTDRFVSYYTNLGLSYKNKYVLSMSGRIDKSNIFGVNANKKGVPLWSTGLAWKVSEEDFYKLSLIPYAKIRASFGYNGNVNKSLSAYTTASYSSVGAVTALPFASIENPPNPELRWEKVKVLNFGLDFSTLDNRISGSIDYYKKNGIDLIGDASFPPSSGITSFRGNVANTKGNGLDIFINTQNIKRQVSWNTVFMFSKAKDIVTEYLLTKGSSMSFIQNVLRNPTVGKPLYAIYSFASAGLDPQTGDPLGYLEGEKSKDWTKIVSNTKYEDLIFHGSSRPKLFGAIRNSISWRDISISMNVSYRFDYYFRKNSIRYSNDYGLGTSHGDYEFRWKESGDEKHTHVPSVPTVYNGNRDNLYVYGETLIEKGDHIRIEDIQLTYTLPEKFIQKYTLSNMHLYFNASNIGMVWQKSRGSVDPDYSGIGQLRPSKIYSLGLRINF